ncbi:imidazole glycerol phosphate synthase subunit HisH [Sphingomonas glaciei]|uniref:Imidazole glycerol phosphate synthase subunit HisH n=1 Tax=Sphingomonas glaciei TaxID=2938948 RepID=A0ABY5MWJ1_9SPHN|nr:imidazole glycerol phosphate synthase subunit HisH [Sphingomonas glaciei]UUR08633.1 imidazole glycerol phosphate synthase subunit HisH [Sphingomonas glaciei]
MTAVTLVDLGYGNLGSIETSLRRLGAEVTRASDPEGIVEAERLLLPGVGAARFAMERIGQLGLRDALRDFKRPALGICLGMHLLFEHSEEGEVETLGLLPGTVRQLQPAPGITIPHMGWSKLEVAAQNVGLSSGDYVYFAHSFAAPDVSATVAIAQHGVRIPAVVRSGNWTGAQFHPERSGPVGTRFLSSWLST